MLRLPDGDSGLAAIALMPASLPDDCDRHGHSTP
jgi:hypothetical protein